MIAFILILITIIVLFVICITPISDIYMEEAKEAKLNKLIKNCSDEEWEVFKRIFFIINKANGMEDLNNKNIHFKHSPERVVVQIKNLVFYTFELNTKECSFIQIGNEVVIYAHRETFEIFDFLMECAIEKAYNIYAEDIKKQKEQERFNVVYKDNIKKALKYLKGEE